MPLSRGDSGRLLPPHEREKLLIAQVAPRVLGRSPHVARQGLDVETVLRDAIGLQLEPHRVRPGEAAEREATLVAHKLRWVRLVHGGFDRDTTDMVVELMRERIAPDDRLPRRDGRAAHLLDQTAKLTEARLVDSDLIAIQVLYDHRALVHR